MKIIYKALSNSSKIMLQLSSSFNIIYENKTFEIQQTVELKLISLKNNHFTEQTLIKITLKLFKML